MPEELEWKTRKDRVDRKLTSLHPAWAVVKYRPDLDTASLSCHAVEEYPTQSGPADYALFVKGRLLGIIEAKKVKVGPANVLEQAKRYARGASDGPGNWHGFRVPFLYATNGEVIHFLDVRNARNLSRRIEQFHTADALEEMFGRQAGFGQGHEDLLDEVGLLQFDGGDVHGQLEATMSGRIAAARLARDAGLIR